jgi:hypothetical protein
MTGTIFAACSTLAILALCIYVAIAEIQKQTPRNSKRRFGI